MNTPQPDTAIRRQRLLVLWILWAAIVIGLVMIHGILHTSYSEPAAKSRAFLGLPLIPLAVSIVVRVLVIPKVKTFTTLMPVFMIGLATAEGCGLLGTFLYGGWDSFAYFAISVATLLCYAPIYARNLQESGS